MCHIASNAPYAWPSRTLSSLTKASIRRSVVKSNISVASVDTVVKCLERICQFESSLFIPQFKVIETLSWVEIVVDLGEVHLGDLQHMCSGFNGSIIDVGFIDGNLTVKIRRHASSVRDGKAEKRAQQKIQ